MCHYSSNEGVVNKVMNSPFGINDSITASIYNAPPPPAAASPPILMAALPPAVNALVSQFSSSSSSSAAAAAGGIDLAATVIPPQYLFKADQSGGAAVSHTPHTPHTPHYIHPSSMPQFAQQGSVSDSSINNTQSVASTAIEQQHGPPPTQFYNPNNLQPVK